MRQLIVLVVPFLLALYALGLYMLRRPDKSEYNSNTSAGHPTKDDDIVRYSEETRRVQDKELEQ